MFVSFMHASVAGVISVGHLVVATSTMEVHKRLMSKSIKCLLDSEDVMFFWSIVAAPWKVGMK